MIFADFLLLCGALFLNMLSTFLGADDEKSIAIELMDFFSPYYGNGIYYTSTVPYNPMENNWRLTVKSSR